MRNGGYLLFFEQTFASLVADLRAAFSRSRRGVAQKAYAASILLPSLLWNRCSIYSSGLVPTMDILVFAGNGVAAIAK